jgi:hypothetical protein
MADKFNKVLNNIITGDETWCFLYDVQTKRQPSKCKSFLSTSSKQFRVDSGTGKVMLKGS